MTTIEDQIKKTMQKAWCDIIEKKIRETPPDFEYVVELYKEMRERLIKILKVGSKTRKDIEESLDVSLFRQMITNDVFNRDNFKDLVYYVFQNCITLGSPKRDEDTKKYRDELSNDIDTAENIFSIVPKFFLYINTCIDWIYEDLANLRENIEKELKTSKV